MLFIAPSGALAEESEESERTMAPGQGVPASGTIGGGAIMAPGRIMVAWNPTYLSKHDGQPGTSTTNTRNIDSDAFTHRLKIRFGLLDWLELNTVTPYAINDPMKGRTTSGFGDLLIGPNIGILQERRGDPMSLGLLLRVGVPTGSVGTHYAAGSGIWSANAILAVTKTFGVHAVTLECTNTFPLQEGNQNTRKGRSMSFNYKYAYALNRSWDVGIEGMVDKVYNGARNGVEVENNSLEWYTGPAVNYVVPGTNLRLSGGAYLPAYRSYAQNTSSADMRFDWKISYVW